MNLVRDGAADYLAKPWDDDKLLATVRNLLETGSAGAREPGDSGPAPGAAQQTGHRVRSVWPDLIPARSCTNWRCWPPSLLDSVLARSLDHRGQRGWQGIDCRYTIQRRNSRVPERPLRQGQCGALPADLIEAELFGARACASTGCRQGTRRPLRSGGSKERCSLTKSATCHPKVRSSCCACTDRHLRTTWQHHVPAGLVRLICATNADLPALIRSGRFRGRPVITGSMSSNCSVPPPLRGGGGRYPADSIATCYLPDGRFSHDDEQALFAP